MFLKSKWRNLSIKKKIFLWSSLIIIISFTLLYICMYFFMPRVYEVYKVNNINEKIRELKSQLEKDENIILFNPGATEDGRYGIIILENDSIQLFHRQL